MVDGPEATETDPVFDGVAGFEVSLSELVERKLSDAEVPGFLPEFTSEEAEMAGAFAEDAMAEPDALESATDLPHALGRD